MSEDLKATELAVPGYQIIQPIGHGGMGRVFLARQLSLGRLVAIKLLTLTVGAGSAEQVARFRRESEIMARVNHPNIVSVFDSGEVGGQPYLAMEYVEKGDLRQFMPPGRPMRGDQAIALLAPITRALAHLHSLGILHRDLKPENILMASESTPKVSDFGIALQDDSIGPLTGLGEWRGTIGYVAPEQQYRLKVDERADQYSLAALSYEMLTGQKPVGRFKPPSQLNTSLRREVDAVLSKGLQEDPDDRYSTILGFGDALQSALGPSDKIRRITLKRTTLYLGSLVLFGLGAYALWSVIGAQVGAKPAEVKARSAPPAVKPSSFQNALGMQFVLIPSGEFFMGSNIADPAAEPGELPEHRVKITTPFYLSAHEVTMGQFQAFVRDKHYKTEAERDGLGGYIYDFAKKTVTHNTNYNWRNPGYPHPSENDPVVQVSWNDAVAFCEWLGDQDDRAYRLPTEAEWEYSCRAGSPARWSSGDELEALDKEAWIFANADSRPHPVGLKRANAFGLFDMHGNAWEWCLDHFGPYATREAVDPTGPDAGEYRVLRGGAWDWEQVEKSRSASRLDSRPTFRFFTYGFRVCLPRK